MKAPKWCVISLLSASILPGCSNASPTTPSTPVFTPNTLPPLPGNLSAVMTSMLHGLIAQINSAISTNQQLIPNNPSLYAQLSAKIAMLQSPSLAADIINGSRWVDGTSSGVRPTPVGLVFPLESMRADGADAVTVLASGMPILETFFDEPYPAASLRVWYGFVLGNSAGGGVINSEERSSYLARTSAGAPPFDAILCHEMSHSYMGNEALNQFLELYVFNARLGSSADPATWTFTRSWTPGLASNRGIAAVLDVYQLIGHDAMRAAYHAVRPLSPAYGSPLSVAVIDAFVSQVPAPLQDQVRQKLGTIVA